MALSDYIGWIVTAGAATSTTSELWLVTGPYWQDGGDDAAIGAFSAMLDNEAEALEYARQLVADRPGCKLIIWPRGAVVPIIE